MTDTLGYANWDTPDSRVQQKEMAAVVRFVLAREWTRTFSWKSITSQVLCIVEQVSRMERTSMYNPDARAEYAAERSSYIIDRLTQAGLMPTHEQHKPTFDREREVKRGIADLLIAGELGSGWDTQCRYMMSQGGHLKKSYGAV